MTQGSSKVFPNKHLHYPGLPGAVLHYWPQVAYYPGMNFSKSCREPSVPFLWDSQRQSSPDAITCRIHYPVLFMLINNYYSKHGICSTTMLMLYLAAWLDSRMNISYFYSSGSVWPITQFDNFLCNSGKVVHLPNSRRHFWLFLLKFWPASLPFIKSDQFYWGP